MSVIYEKLNYYGFKLPVVFTLIVVGYILDFVIQLPFIILFHVDQWIGVKPVVGRYSQGRRSLKPVTAAAKHHRSQAL